MALSGSSAFASPVLSKFKTWFLVDWLTVRRSHQQQHGVLLLSVQRHNSCIINRLLPLQEAVCCSDFTCAPSLQCS